MIFVSDFLTPLSGRAGAVAVLALAASLTAACSTGQPGADVASQQLAGVTHLPATTSALQPLGTADPAPKSQRPLEPTRLAVVGVRIGNHEGFDRVVLDLAGDGEPGWFVDYTPTPMQTGIGRPLAVSGNAFLNINVDGTVYPREIGIDSEIEDKLPVERDGATGNIVDVVSGGTYEGRSQVVVGLRSEAPYSVQVLENPMRLVIDIVQS